MIDRAFACKGSVHHHLGLLAATVGDHIAATEHLHAALAIHETKGAVLLAGRTKREMDRIRHDA